MSSVRPISQYAATLPMRKATTLRHRSARISTLLPCSFTIYYTDDSHRGGRSCCISSGIPYLIGWVIGVMSQCLDTGYFKAFFSGGYYQETMNNIKSGNPMGIYGSQGEVEMYFNITLNNMYVGLHYFVSGLLTPFYTIYMTITTGTMLGCFTTFFAQHGYLTDALIAPNEHGSLELPAAIVCSAAGMQLGMGWFFPGKLTRLKALMQSAREALTMALAMMPFFMIAGFIESFITRHQEWPMAVRILLMVAGLAFSVYYIILLPRQLGKKERQ